MTVSSVSNQASALDFTEMRKKMAERMAERMLKDLDGDGDGSISKNELAKASTAVSGASATNDSSGTSLDDLFTALDSDGDGAISQSDLANVLEKAGPPDGGPRGAGGPPPDRAPANSSTSSESDSSSASNPEDANGDGTVSAEERMAFAYQQLMAALQRISDSTSKNQNTMTVTS